MSSLHIMAQERDNVISIRKQPKSRKLLLERLFSKHRECLRTFLRYRTRGVEDVDDIAQEVFVRLARMPDLEERLPSEGRDNKAFILTVANNLVVDLERRKAIRRENLLESLDGSPAFESYEISPEVMVSGMQELSVVEKAILELPVKWRTAFVLSRFKYMSYKEIADRMGVTTRTVENYMSNALEKMRGEVSRATGEGR